MKIQKWISLTFVSSLLLAHAGCYSHAARSRINVADIPDKVYEVYVYSFTPDVYAVLLDIPNDGKRVFMRHTDKTERAGMARPGPYIAEFQRRIKGFRSATRITDEQGLDRGYLMISLSLSYMVKPHRNDIMVYIWEPFLEEELGPRLHPGIIKKRPMEIVD